MKHPLIWNDWRASIRVVAGATAVLAGFGVVVRLFDDVRGLAVFTAFLATFLGHAVSSTDATVAAREFYLTRPISRRRYLRTRLLFAGGVLNAFVAAMLAIIHLDLPARFYGLFAESNAGVRVVVLDFPHWYPAAVLLPNLVLLLVVGMQMTASRLSSLAVGAAFALAGVIGPAALVARYPQHYTALAIGVAVVFAVAIVVGVVHLFGRFDRLDVTGDYA